MKKSVRRKGRKSRPLNLQSLESRQLLAADVGGPPHPDPLEVSPRSADVGGLNDAGVERIDQQGQGINAPRPEANGEAGPNDLRDNDTRGPSDRGDRDGPRGDNTPPRDRSVEVRSIDGTGNNLEDSALGSAGTELRRLVESDYNDGISDPSGGDRLSAREISNIVAAQEESILSDRGLSDLVWQWGQFIDHDIDLTAEGDGEEFNIDVPAGDPYFDPGPDSTGTEQITLHRSGVAEGTGVDSPAQQINAITSFIDGSMIYGSDEATASSLREFEGGRLLTSENDLLPRDESGFFFLAGDVRVNEQQGLTAMHTLWMREHNRIAEEIAASRPGLTDEQIFQEARAIVIGELQAITFNEYLPTLLGRDAIPQYEGYDPSVDPSISNLFATAAFRYGHTSLSSELLRLDDDGNVIDEGNIALRNAFFNPTDITQLGIDPLLKGLASNVSQEIDTQLVDDVRNFLFGEPGSGGFDLASLNIQRGRDHGLPDYNSVREQLGLERVESFADITSDPELQAKLEQAYDNVDNIDVWVGSLAEDHVRGASVGELTRTVLSEQFTALRDGDRFWYQNTFSGDQLREIESTRLSDVIERNTDLTSIQDNAFIVPGGGTDRPGDGQRRPDRRDGPQRDGGPSGPSTAPSDGPVAGEPINALLPGNAPPVDGPNDSRNDPPDRRGPQQMTAPIRSSAAQDGATPDRTGVQQDPARSADERDADRPARPRAGGGLDPIAVDQIVTRLR